MSKDKLYFNDTQDMFDSEIYTNDKIAEELKLMAMNMKVHAKNRHGRNILIQTYEYASELNKIREEILEESRRGGNISHATEWIADNFHIIQDQIREIYEDLPKPFYRELPKIVDGPDRDFPRIKAIAFYIVDHSDGIINDSALQRQLQSFQKVMPLKISEIWAFPIFLRIALIHKLANLAKVVNCTQNNMHSADLIAKHWHERQKNDEFETNNFLEEVKSCIKQRPKSYRSFLISLYQHLQEHETNIAPILDWIKASLHKKEISLEEAIKCQCRNEAICQTTIANIIGSMRFISTLEWEMFFQKVSLVEKVLNNDPSKIYAMMDVQTKNQYRTQIEILGRGCSISEIEVAQVAIDQATKEIKSSINNKLTSHVGYYIVGDGALTLEKAISYKIPIIKSYTRYIKSINVFTYFLFLCLFTTLFCFSVFSFTFSNGAPLWKALILSLTFLIPASDLAVATINLFISTSITPKKLPKIDVKNGIPFEQRSFIVIPALLINHKIITQLIHDLEISYISNQDPNIFFALLTDFQDATTCNIPDDISLLEFAKKNISDLNNKYKMNKTPHFFLFQRERKWNESESIWMGWERKRGKLHEFNRLLRGATDTSYIIENVDYSFLSSIKNVITLDAGTFIPRDNGKKLIGTIMHPLNAPSIDPITNEIVNGYVILQPKVVVDLNSANATLFARYFSGHTGIDPYSTAVSDTYQDIFGEGIYVGKGLYVVDAFEQSLADKIPENYLLSHDLFEGIHSKVALVSDLELIEDYPSHYNNYIKRLHRWTRGDWQIFPWIFPFVPSSKKSSIKNKLSAISRWKIFDNLRRSLSPISILLWPFFVILLYQFPPMPLLMFALLALAFPIYSQVAKQLAFYSPKGWNRYSILQIWGNLKESVIQTIMYLIFLPHQALYQVDAIIRSLYRRMISKKGLLRWVTAQQVEMNHANKLSFCFKLMWQESLFTALLLPIIFFYSYDSLALISPILCLWALAPVFAYYLGKPIGSNLKSLDEDEINTLRQYALRTWHYFDNIIKKEYNFLAPDNFQEMPEYKVAYRTSPTNMGIQLLSSICAHDFGYLGKSQLLGLLTGPLDSMHEMQRYHGHFFNWYDIKTLKALSPHYISSVDSGNLAACVLTVTESCQEILRQDFFSPQLILGLQDMLQIILSEVIKNDFVIKDPEISSYKLRLEHTINQATKLIKTSSVATLTAWSTLFRNISQHVSIIEDINNTIASSQKDELFKNVRQWINLIKNLIKHEQDSIEQYFPWVELLTSNLYQEMDSCCQQLFLNWDTFNSQLNKVPSVIEINDHYNSIASSIFSLRAQINHDMHDSNPHKSVASKYLHQIIIRLNAKKAYAYKLIKSYNKVIDGYSAIFTAMDFKLLFNQKRKLFHIGLNHDENIVDNSYYDLLASESRLGSFVAIAKGDIPLEHWYHLGRHMTRSSGRTILISWSASMFEYLMPLILMKDIKHTLLDQTANAAVACQIKYAKKLKIPWGISESAFNARDFELNYQYGPFGIPGLGLKRGLSNDIVVSPYSTLLALMLAPGQALKNLDRLEKEGMLSQYGFYESIDYTSERVSNETIGSIIKSYMTHHQGMSLMALNNVLNSNIMQNRFHKTPIVESIEYLLHERIPKSQPIFKPRQEESRAVIRQELSTPYCTRSFGNEASAIPNLQFLSNTNYSLMLSDNGSGISKCDDYVINRWYSDSTLDNFGSYIYLRDISSNKSWSITRQPMGQYAKSLKTSFSDHKVEYWNETRNIHSHLGVIVSARKNVEIRQVTLKNISGIKKTIEVTSYIELALSNALQDKLHPAFSKLFVHTEFLGEHEALLANRRKRANEETELWSFHLVVDSDDHKSPLQFDTSREKFIGRGRSVHNPIVLESGNPLSMTTGAVLDPIFSLRKTIAIHPGQSKRISFASGLAFSKDEALSLIAQFHDKSAFTREEELCWTFNSVQRRHFQIDSKQAQLYCQFAQQIVYANYYYRTKSVNQYIRPQSQLWAMGISGDWPIVALKINNINRLNVLHEVLKCHEFLHYKGLKFDLVIVNEDQYGYIQELHNEILKIVEQRNGNDEKKTKTEIFVVNALHISYEDKQLLSGIAHVILSTNYTNFEDQVKKINISHPLQNKLVVTKKRLPHSSYNLNLDSDAEFFNGLGGFTSNGKEYSILLDNNQWSPSPWSNVICNNPNFGTQVTEAGSAMTWSVNSQENRITPWNNDPISDTSGECIYLRDEERGTFWSPTPLPIRDQSPYLITHGQGYTRYLHVTQNIRHEMLVFTPIDGPVKIIRLNLSNLDSSSRTISITYFVDLVLGKLKEQTSHFVMTKIDTTKGIIFAQNLHNNEYANATTFCYLSGENKTYTCDRLEFFGSCGRYSSPASLQNQALSGRDGLSLDPCACIRSVHTLAASQESSYIFLLGQTSNLNEIDKIIASYSTPAGVKDAFKNLQGFWHEKLSFIKITTPDQSMNIMINHWLLYQTIACRLYSRTAFYQSGGAFGFRDQLQDVMALIHSEPQKVREHILKSAARQFEEGDVQHWWNPVNGGGVRTRFSDDLLWLPFVTNYYIKATGDTTILSESIPFISGPILAEKTYESYFIPDISKMSATLYQHCKMCLERSFKYGVHGLPLMGSGDWNDGMNLVGREGKGESVWLAEFLYFILANFNPSCDTMNDGLSSKRYLAEMQKLKNSLDQNAWDGSWYRRAYMDDGQPLGSAQNEECRINSIAQSWSVFSDIAPIEKKEKAMRSFYDFLVQKEDNLVLLLTPPFDRTSIDPGYIKGYIPGIRENGSQYTHAAVWAVKAFATLGNGDTAYELFSILNPINHALNRASVYKYKVEPYVVAADIYSASPFTGRGGWTWYTGSAALLYLTGIESILGLKLEQGCLRIDPCIPHDWPGYEIDYRYQETIYHIKVENPQHISRGKISLMIDNQTSDSSLIELHNDKTEHFIQATLTIA